MEAFSELVIAMLGIVTAFIMQGLKKVLPLIDNLPAWGKSVLVLFLSTATVFVGGLLGVSIPADPNAWSPEVINSILVSLVAMGSHALKGAVKKTDG